MKVGHPGGDMNNPYTKDNCQPISSTLAIPDYLIWRHSHSCVSDDLPLNGYDQNHVEQLCVHFIKLREINEAIIFRSGLSSVWSNQLCDLVFRRMDDNSVMSIYDFMNLPSGGGGAKVTAAQPDLVLAKKSKALARSSTPVLEQTEDVEDADISNFCADLENSLLGNEGNFMPSKPDFSFFSQEEFVNEPIVSEPTVKKPVVETSEAKASTDKPKAVKKNNGAPIIEDWVSDSEEEDMPQAKIQKKTVKPSFAKIEFVKSKEQGNPQQDLEEKGVIDIYLKAHSLPYAEFKPSGDDEKKVTEEPRKEGGDPSKEGKSNDQEKEDNIELPDDLNMPELEDIVYSDDYEDVGTEMDIKSAFFYGNIEEEFYICQPPGFEDPDSPDRVYKVEKALYGLHQAPRA
ncbi:putative ribonuclease H-like domain-containing protein [Tanacetum coccineum]